MRIGWLLLFFPSLAFAIGGCPVGVQLGNVTVATSLPVCLKFESSSLGGCLVDCKGVCVELPLANKKGPVETTGTACSYSDNGSGNGDSDGSGNTPDEGHSGTKPIDGWLDFQPVIGDATGTSVSGAVAKLNKNLGLALRQVVDSTNRDSNNINSITHSAESLSRDMKTNLFHLDNISSNLFYTRNSNDALLGAAYKTNEYLQSIISKMDGSGSSGDGSSGSSSSFGPDQAHQLEGLTVMMGQSQGLWSQTASLTGEMNQATGRMSNFTEQNLSNTSKMVKSLSSIEGLLKSSGSGSGSGSGSDASIDYSKMPGSSSNPLSVGDADYKSACSGDNCFFDVPGMEQKLVETNKSLADKYTSITEDVKQVFSFSLTGSADPMECLDLFTHQGKEYTICPPSGDYWKTLAALMMFIFYFVALMIIFKR